MQTETILDLNNSREVNKMFHTVVFILFYML